MNDLNNLFPSLTTVTIGGEPLTVMPLKVGQLPTLLRLLSPFVHRLSAETIDWLALFGEHGENVLAAMAYAIGKPRTWLDALEADEALVLATRLVEVNADFFTQRVLPHLDTLLSLTQAVEPTPGSTPSSD